MLTNAPFLQKAVLKFCDPEVADMPEGRLLSAILAQALADLSRNELSDHRTTAHFFLVSDACRGLCDHLGLSYESVMQWRKRIG